MTTTILTFISSCGFEPVPDSPDSCTWQNGGTILFSNLKLHHPAGLDCPNYFNDFQNDAIYFLDEILEKGGEIYVDVTGNNCEGTRTTSYSDYPNENIGISQIQSVELPRDAMFNSVVEIYTKPYVNFENGEEIKFIWTKVVPKEAVKFSLNGGAMNSGYEIDGEMWCAYENTSEIYMDGEYK